MKKRSDQDAVQGSEKKYRALFDNAPVGISVIDASRNVLEANRALEKVAKFPDRKNLEIILKASEEKFRALFENSMDAIFLAGPDGIIYSANPAACIMFGRPEEEILKLGRNGIVDKTDPRLEAGLKERELKGRFSGELTFIKKDGTRFSGELYSNVFNDSEGCQLTSMIIRDISEQKKAEAELKESEKKYRSLFESMQQGVFYQAANGNLIDVNEAALDMFGLTRDEFLDRTSYHDGWKVIDEKGTPLTPGQHPSMIALSSGKPVKDMTVGVFNHRTNQFTWVITNAIPIYRSQEEKPSQVYVTMHNITEKKNTEYALAKSEKRYQFLFDNMLNGLAYCQMVFDDSGKPVDFIYLEVNESFSKLTGLTNVIGKRVTDVIPGIFQMDSELFNIYGRVALTGEPENCEIRIKSLDHWFSVSVYCPLKNHFVAIFDVISDRKNSEEKLLASEADFRSLFDNSIVGISQSYPGGNLIRINKAYAEMYGYPDTTTMFNEVADNMKTLFANPEDRKKVLETLDKTGYMAPSEFKLNRRNGDKFWALVMAKQVKDKTGKILYLQVEHIDISRQKKLEADLRKSKKLLEKLNQHLVDVRENERNQIALNLHDDLGQKLTAINLNIAWLKNRIGVQSQVVKEKIKEMSLMIIETIESIKETSSLLRPAILFDFGLIPAIKAQLSHFEKQTGIKCHFFCKLERIILDNRISLILYRILQESLTNIARHSGASITEINLHVLKNKLGMSIKDNGKGIKKDQINSMKSMGIEGIKERVRSAQGKLAIRGIHGSGTTIKVLIPLN